jgi:transcriptional regulator with XRE-family HTH domain
LDLEKPIKIELIRQGLRQLDLANRLGLPLTTFSSYMRGAVRPPHGFRERVEEALGLPRGALKPASIPSGGA